MKEMNLVWCISTWSAIPVTYRKIYEVLEELNSHYIIIDDKGDRRYIQKKRFIPLGDHKFEYFGRKLDEAYNQGYRDGVKQITCDIRNSITNIAKQNGL